MPSAFRRIADELNPDFVPEWALRADSVRVVSEAVERGDPAGLYCGCGDLVFAGAIYRSLEHISAKWAGGP